MLELSTIDILRSLNFLLKFVIVNDAFPWSCRLVGVEIVILHFGNLIPSVYTFSAEEFYPIFLLICYQEYHLSQCAKCCNPVISKVVASYNHTCLHELLGSILLWLCFPVFNRFSSISANNESNNEACTFWKRMIGQNLFIICESNEYAVIVFANFS